MRFSCKKVCKKKTIFLLYKLEKICYTVYVTRMADFLILRKELNMITIFQNGNAPEQNDPTEKPVPKEGDLYKVITAYGKTFHLYYGYYEECDRYSKYNEPVEIYPDFIKEPVYTDDGVPFVTAMQVPCRYFKGELDEDNTCYQCANYKKCDELLGICTCKKNKLTSNKT